ncbi:MAG: enoyl-CoA hydratase/isomerase family protein [Fimbriimonadaceae bacterium]|nr:enoyl-CoA hydratase/isomerase family protein [Alphaproteobacteria bacterium]
MFEQVELKVEAGIGTVRLNRPERLNAINPDLLRDLEGALRVALKDPKVEVILLCGAGRAFCAGNDLKDFADQEDTAAAARRIVGQYQTITKLIMTGDKIVVGAIHGWAVGGGLEWALNCDMAIVGKGTRFFFPETQLGLFVTGGVTSILPNLVGLQKAKELILLGAQFDAATAYDMGMISRVVPDEDVLEVARSTAMEIAALPALARRNVKSVLNKAFQLPLDEALGLETEAAVAATLDPEAKKRTANVV